jgi:hypothetical protein
MFFSSNLPQDQLLVTSLKHKQDQKYFQLQKTSAAKQLRCPLIFSEFMPKG